MWILRSIKLDLELIRMHPCNNSKPIVFRSSRRMECTSAWNGWKFVSHLAELEAIQRRKKKKKTRVEKFPFFSPLQVRTSIGCLDASIRNAIRNAVRTRALTCMVAMSMMISDVRRRGKPDLHVPVRVPAVSEIVHSRLLRGRGRLLAGQPGHGSRHLLHEGLSWLPRGRPV